MGSSSQIENCVLLFQSLSSRSRSEFTFPNGAKARVVSGVIIDRVVMGRFKSPAMTVTIPLCVFQPRNTAMRRIFHAIVTNAHSPRIASKPRSSCA